jgi:pimeloyl-ACP methyl ester carboxylesterase
MNVILLVMILIGLLFLGYFYERASRRKDAQKPLPGKMIDVGGYRVHYTDDGQGEPAVVLIHGAGDSSYSWMHIRKELAKFTRVITYDRGGMGSSDPGTIPTPVHTVDELNQLLKQTGITGPYILVGHSLGGLIARLYAAAHPDQIAGLVFLDSTHEHLKDDPKFKQGFAMVGILLKVIRGLSTFGIPRFLGNTFGVIPMFIEERAYYQKQLSTEEYILWKGIVYRMLAGTQASAEFHEAWAHLKEAEQLLQANSEKPLYGDLPIAVVNNPGFGKAWTEMQEELAARSSNHIHRVSDRKGHSLQMPRPELVIEAIYHVLTVAKEGGKVLSFKNHSKC